VTFCDFLFCDLIKNRKCTIGTLAGKKVEDYRRMVGQFGVTGDMALQQIGMLFIFPQYVGRNFIADPGSDAFLTPGSGIRRSYFSNPGSRISGSWILNPYKLLHFFAAHCLLFK
jgi:hypothetical protein